MTKIKNEKTHLPRHAPTMAKRLYGAVVRVVEKSRIWPLQLEERGKAEVANPCKEPLYFLKEVLHLTSSSPVRKIPARCTNGLSFPPQPCRSNGHASSTLSARFVDVGRISCLRPYPLFSSFLSLCLSLFLFFIFLLCVYLAMAFFFCFFFLPLFLRCRILTESRLLKGVGCRCHWPLGKLYHGFLFFHIFFFLCVCMEKGKTVSGTNGVRFDRGWNVAMAWLGLLRLFPFFPLVRESGNLWHLVGISGLEIVLECLSIAREVLIASNVSWFLYLFFFILFYELFHFFLLTRNEI